MCIYIYTCMVIYIYNIHRHVILTVCTWYMFWHSLARVFQDICWDISWQIIWGIILTYHLKHIVTYHLTYHLAYCLALRQILTLCVIVQKRIQLSSSGYWGPARKKGERSKEKRRRRNRLDHETRPMKDWLVSKHCYHGL